MGKGLFYYCIQSGCVMCFPKKASSHLEIIEQELVKTRILRKELREYLKSVDASILVKKSTNDIFGLP